MAEPFSLHNHTRWLLLALLVVLTAYTAWQISPWGGDAFIDFNAFHLAGQAALTVALPEVYDSAQFFARQPSAAPMPYTYPPHFALLLAPLGALPLVLAYLAFTLGSLALFLAVLDRLAPQRFDNALFALYPVLCVNIRAGQTGLLIAAFVGLFCMLIQSKRASAGLWLGLLSLKPHLAIGAGVLALPSRNIWLIGLAFTAVLAPGIAAYLAFGAPAFIAFTEAGQEAGAHLLAADYKLFRMSSAFALLAGFGAHTNIALWLHFALAGTAIMALVYTELKHQLSARVLALGGFVTLLISPYLYDYDLAILGVVLALAPQLPRVAIPLLWLTGCYGMLGHSLPALTTYAPSSIGLLALGFVLFVRGNNGAGGAH